MIPRSALSFVAILACLAASCLSAPVQAQATDAAATGKTGEPLRPSDPIRVTITSPKENEVLPSGDVTFSFDVRNYTLATAGNHLHLIVDGKPYQAVYAPTFEYPETLGEGIHTAVAFASRPWHEAWKDPQSVSIVTFYVGRKTGERPIDPSAPLLLFSRPKGTQEGTDLSRPTNAARILLDFFLWNVDLSPDGYKVQVTIDGKPYFTDQWRSFWVTGLKDGVHVFTMQLLDRKWRPVRTPYAPYRREIEVKGAPASATGQVTITPVLPGPDGNGFMNGMQHPMP